MTTRGQAMQSRGGKWESSGEPRPRNGRVSRGLIVLAVLAIAASSCTTVGGGSPGPLTLAGFGTSPAFVGRNFSEVLIPTGGVAPFSWEVTSGVLPAGLELANGTHIEGTPTSEARVEVGLRVTDSTGAMAETVAVVEVWTPGPADDPPNMTGNALPGGGYLGFSHVWAPSLFSSPFAEAEPYQIRPDGSVASVATRGGIPGGPELFLPDPSPFAVSPGAPDRALVFNSEGQQVADLAAPTGWGGDFSVAPQGDVLSLIGPGLMPAVWLYETSSWSLSRPPGVAEAPPAWRTDGLGMHWASATGTVGYLDASDQSLDRVTPPTLGGCYPDTAVSLSNRLLVSCSTTFNSVTETSKESVDGRTGSRQVVWVGRQCGAMAPEGCEVTGHPFGAVHHPDGTHVAIAVGPLEIYGQPFAQTFEGPSVYVVSTSDPSTIVRMTSPNYLDAGLRMGSGDHPGIWVDEPLVESPEPLTPAPEITTTDLAPVIYGESFTRQLEATGAGPFEWAGGVPLIGDPSDPTIDPSGLLAGTVGDVTATPLPLLPPERFVVATVTDANGRRAAAVVDMNTQVDTSVGETPLSELVALPDSGAILFRHEPADPGVPSGSTPWGMWQLSATGAVGSMLSKSGHLPSIPRYGYNPLTDTMAVPGGPGECLPAVLVYGVPDLGSSIGCASVAFSPDGSKVAVVGNKLSDDPNDTNGVGSDGRVEIYSTADWSPIREFDLPHGVYPGDGALFPATASPEVVWSADSADIAYMAAVRDTELSCEPVIGCFYPWISIGMRIVSSTDPNLDRTPVASPDCWPGDWGSNGRLALGCWDAGTGVGALITTNEDGTDAREIVGSLPYRPQGFYSPSASHLALLHDGVVAVAPDQASAALSALTQQIEYDDGDPNTTDLSSDVPLAWVANPLPSQ